jgi:preprotein translocase subunit SecY
VSNYLFVTLVALILSRLGSYVPIPGIDPRWIAQVSHAYQSRAFDVSDMLTGGARERWSIFALGVRPYIEAWIVVQLLAACLPPVRALKQAGESGRRKLTDYTLWGTTVIALADGYAVSVALERSPGSLFVAPAPYFHVVTALTLAAGTILLVWLGEQSTRRGIGNGIALIVFAGIVANLPRAVGTMLRSGSTGAVPGGVVLFVLVLVAGLVPFIVFVESARRHLMVRFPKRRESAPSPGGTNWHLPLRLNGTGFVAPIVVSSLLAIPTGFATFHPLGNSNSWLPTVAALLWLLLVVGAVAFFVFYLTSVLFSPAEVADSLKKNGCFIPGIRPGPITSDYLRYVSNRLTALGAVYVSIVCTLPEIVISNYPVPIYLHGSSLLIVVIVTLDTVARVRSGVSAPRGTITRSP